MERSTSLFDRLISHPRHPWLMPGLTLLLLLMGFLAVLLDGTSNRFFLSGRWRDVLMGPVVILYILAIAPRLARVEANVVESFRPLVLLDDASFNRVVSEATHIRPRGELIAFAVGVLLVCLQILAASDTAGSSFLTRYLLLSASLMWGLLAWTVYVSLSSRLTTALLRQPLRVDPFDITPFEAIGRQGLLVALVFVGGITLSLLFIGLQPAVFRLPEFWLIYIPLSLVPVVIFFLSMYPTHRVLAAAKKREQQVVQRHIQQAGRDLIQRREENQDIGNLAAETQALIAYDQRLQMARVWPYDTAMLRAVFFSVFIPVTTVLLRYLVERLFGS
jgi:hypothetical protein